MHRTTVIRAVVLYAHNNSRSKINSWRVKYQAKNSKYVIYQLYIQLMMQYIACILHESWTCHHRFTSSKQWNSQYSMRKNHPIKLFGNQLSVIDKKGIFSRWRYLPIKWLFSRPRSAYFLALKRTIHGQETNLRMKVCWNQHISREINFADCEK